MKAAVYEKYGPPEVLKVKEVEKPVPKENEVLVKVMATSINYGDIIARNFKNIPSSEFNMPLILWFPARVAFGLRKPRIKILGSEFAGTVEATGENVTKFSKGDEVFGYPGMKMGANAEYLCVSENGMLTTKPSNMGFEEASTIPYGANMALSLLGKTNIQKGSKVCIIGASGGIGSVALQIAKHYGGEVTGVCSTPRVNYVKLLGADKVIDYTAEDFTKNGEKYDLIFDILGKNSFTKIKTSLATKGIYLLASFKTKKLLQMLWTKFFSSKKVICAMASEQVTNLVYIRELIEKGKIKSVIDKIYPLEQIAEAHNYVENGNKKGNILIKLNEK